MTTAQAARDGHEATGRASAGAHFTGFESLRALAAIMVVAHHASSFAGEARTGAFHEVAAVMDSGVAVFFVLSGFLIYRPFAVAAIEGRSAPGTVAFWWRRALRIVPAYWVALTFFWAIGSFELGDLWWRYYLFAQVYSQDTVLGGIVQAWSLCTEITFYLVVPFWAAAVARLASGAAARSRALTLLAGCGVLWLGGFASRWYIESQLSDVARRLSFNWLPTNLDLFAAGMALAVVSAWAGADHGIATHLHRLARRVEPWWAAAVTIFLWYAYAVGPADFATGYSGWFWHRRQLVLAVLTVLLMVPAVFGTDAGGWIRRAWSAPAVVWVGLVSYGLYLWHFDWMKRSIRSVDGFGQLRWEGWVHSAPGQSSFLYLLLVGLGAGLLFAALSWYLLEEPSQRWKGLVHGRRRTAR